MLSLLGFIVAFSAALPHVLAEQCIWPFGIQTCDPNCADGVTYCDLSKETCLNNFVGGCDTSFHTLSVIVYINVVVSTQYTATEQQYSTETQWQYVTVDDIQSMDITATVTQTSVQTETAPGVTVTESVQGRAKLLMRDLTVTTTTTVDCNFVADPSCTSVVPGVSTAYLTTTDTPTSTVISGVVNLYTSYYTTWAVSTYTYIPDTVTTFVTIEPEQSDLPQSEEPESSQEPESSEEPSLAAPTSPFIIESSAANPTPASRPTDSFSTVIVPTANIGDARGSSALHVLQTAVPKTAQDDPAGACFLFTKYTSVYTTPSWYTGLSTDVQSYFRSLNADNTASCAPSPTSASVSSVRLSAGTKGGIAGGTIAGVALLAGVAYLAYSKLFAPHKTMSDPVQTMANEPGPQMGQTMHSAPQAGDYGQNLSPTAQTTSPGWNGVTGDPSNGTWNGVTGDPSTSGPWNGVTGDPSTSGPWNGVTGDPSTSGPWNGVTGDPSTSGPWNGVTGDPSTSGPWNGVTGDPSTAHGAWNGIPGSSPPPNIPPPPASNPDPFFLIAGAARRRSQEDTRITPPPQSYDKPILPSTYSAAAASQSSIPRRGVPPRSPSDISGGDPFADSGGSVVSGMGELSTGGAVRGQEAGGSEVYEAPSPGGGYGGGGGDGRQGYGAPAGRGGYFVANETDGRERYEAPGSRNY